MYYLNLNRERFVDHTLFLYLGYLFTLFLHSIYYYHLQSQTLTVFCFFFSFFWSHLVCVASYAVIVSFGLHIDWFAFLILTICFLFFFFFFLFYSFFLYFSFLLHLIFFFLPQMRINMTFNSTLEIEYQSKSLEDFFLPI